MFDLSKLLSAANAALATAETTSPEIISFLDEARKLASEAGQLTHEIEQSFQQHVVRLTGSTAGLTSVLTRDGTSLDGSNAQASAPIETKSGVDAEPVEKVSETKPT